MKTMRDLLTVLLVLLCTSVANAEVYTDGETELTWDLTSDGELKIEGVGCVPRIYVSPWKEHKDIITKVSIGEGITELEGNAFYECPKLTSVVIPKTIEDIGLAAFSGCTALNSISLPEENSLKHIDSYVFDDTPWYNNKPDGFVYLGSWLVYYKGKNSVNSNLSVQSGTVGIADRALYNQNNITSITLPNGLKYIGNSAFYGCGGLTSITIPEGVIRIGANAFENCIALTSISIPNSLKVVDYDAFARCDKLHECHISSLEDWCKIDFAGINSTPFYSSRSSDKNSGLYLNGTLIEELTIPNSIKEIKNFAFVGNKCLTSITIPKGVTSIGEAAFIGCYNVDELEIPQSVTSLHNHAFAGTKVSSIVISKNVTEITGNPFVGMGELTSLSVEEGNPVYDSRYNCNAIIHTQDHVLVAGCGTTVIPNDVTAIGQNAFTGIYNLTSIVIPGSVKTIDTNAFNGCSNLVSVDIQDGVEVIKEDAFNNCLKLSALIFPKSIKQIENEVVYYGFSGTIICYAPVPPTIDEYSFSGVNSLTLYVPYNVVDVYKTAQYWSKFAKIQPIKEFENWTSNNQYKGGTTSSKTYTIVAPLGTTLSFDWLVSSESSYDRLIVTLDGEQLLETSGEECGHIERIISQGEHTLIAKYIKDDSGYNGNDQASLSNIKIDAPEVINGISYKLTNNNKAMVIAVADDANVVIPSTITINNETYDVTEIAANAFSDCPNLTTVTIPNTVTTIGAYAFENCGTLGSATLSTALTSIGEGAFKNCISLASISAIPNTVTSISHSTFEGCAALTAISLPNALNSIGESAFKGCTNLATVTIPSTVTAIGGSAFQGCASLSTIALPNGVTSIGSRTFSECTNLTSIDIPQTMTSIGEYAFYNCEKIQTMTIPKSVSWMGDRAFEGCGGEHYLNCNTYNNWGDGPYCNSKITKVTIGEGVKVIGRNAFNCSYQLSEVILPSTVTQIEQNAFSNTNLSTIELPAGIQSVYDNALPSSMSKMRCNAITPPALLSDGGMPSLGNISIIYVPQGCGQAYRDVYPWSSKVIFDGNGITAEVTVTPGMMGEAILNDPDVNYLSDVNNLIILGGSINDTDIANIKNSMPNLVSIDMAELDMKNIPSKMFFDRKALLSIILPNNVETIGAYAFHNCINLESIVLPEGLKRIENGNRWIHVNGQYYEIIGCFDGCRSLKSVSFPSTLESVGDVAFYGCNRLQKVEFKEGTTIIGRSAFENCSSLNELTLPNSLISISAGAFKDCISLRNLIIPEGVTSIGNKYESDYNDWEHYGAFENCSSIKQVTLPKGLQEICQRTFYNCSSLTTIDIPEGVTYIGRNAFKDCSILVSINLPSTLAACSSTPFAGCNKLNEVSCLALFPPTLADGLLTLEDMGLPLKRTLNVPEWTINRYKLTSGWAAFTKMEPIVGVYPSTISVVGDAILTMPTAGLPANYKPEMVFPEWYNPNQMMAYGNASSLHLRGAGMLAISNFDMNSGYQASMKQLLNEEAAITADKVNVSMYLNNTYYQDGWGERTQWHFLSFPFDVKLSDVVTNCDWVVRHYDGKARANNKLDNTWVTVPHDGTLNAGQGYIWACNDGGFTLPAVDNANKNLIFATTRRDIPLQEYAAELVSNSSWNLVGNPFPCYYNTNEMDYTAPITVWENNTYAAYSPVDDSYVLRPFEAFFVQCPKGVKSIGFKPEGRQLQSTSTTPATAPSRIQAKAERQVINLVLSNANSADRTRIVINNDAKMDYELTCDAAKFMSDDTNVPQIYSVSNGEIFAINERPMGNGIVKLGTHFGMAGTYTIAMQIASNMVVVLVDHKTGIETDLTAGDYTFSAEAGDCNRFEVRMYADEETTAIDAVAADTKVVAISNAIVVTTSTDADVELYNAAGSLMAVGKGKSMTFDAAQGMYIVKVNGVSHKVAVVK